MKSLADGQEATGLIPAIVDPVPVQVHTVSIRVDIRDVTVAITVRDGAILHCIAYLLFHCPLSSLGAVFYSGAFTPLIRHTKYLHLLKKRGMYSTRYHDSEYSDNTIALEFNRPKP